MSGGKERRITYAEEASSEDEEDKISVKRYRSDLLERKRLLELKLDELIRLKEKLVNAKTFNPVEYKITFPFFQGDEEKYLSLQDREDVIREINTWSGYQHGFGERIPVFIIGNRGMGKTFLLKMFGLQKVPAVVVNEHTMNAGKYGRILSFDFKAAEFDRTTEGMRNFFPHLMIFFLCRLFDGCVVDGILFEEIPSVNLVPSFETTHDRFNMWKDRLVRSCSDTMIDEYIRLTNIAFNVDCGSLPVFLLDEIQELCVPTVDKPLYDGAVPTFLSDLLFSVGIQCRPTVVLAGTGEGNVHSVVGRGRIRTPILRLTPLKFGFRQNWDEMTSYRRDVLGLREDSMLQSDLVDSLIELTYKIPKLLDLAHKLWFDNQLNIHQVFLDEVIKLYPGMKQLWSDYTVEEISHILLSTGCRWEYWRTGDHVPGTSVTWRSLEDKGIIFSYEVGFYMFPFALVWRIAKEVDKSEDLKNQIFETCRKFVPNLDVSDMFLTSSRIKSGSRLDLFERLIASSCAVKHYLWRISQDERAVPVESSKTYVSFNDLYAPTFVEWQSRRTRSLSEMDDKSIDFSEGIDIVRDGDAFAASIPIKHAVIVNRNLDDTNHQIRLHSTGGPIPVHASLVTPTAKKIKKLIKEAKKSQITAPIFILVLLETFPNYDFRSQFGYRVAFVNGTSFCSDESLDMLRMTV